MSLSTDDIVGKYAFRLKKKIKVYTGYPNSNRVETWGPGTSVSITPKVQSYIERSGNVWWQIGQIEPIRWIKHDPDALEPTPVSGADPNNPLGSSNSSGSGFFSGAGSLLDAVNVQNISRIFKAGALLVALYVGWQIWQQTQN